MAKPHQVFISYARENEAFAHQLADELEKRNIKVWIDRNSIRSGDGWVNKIENGLIASSHFLLVLTPAAMRSDWVNLEVQVAFNRAVRKTIKFIPLYIQEFEIGSPFLNSLQWIDFHQGFNEGLERLLKDFEFSDIIIEERTELSIPYPYNPYFIGQEETLAEIHRALSAGKPAGLIGVPGIGKTQIAVKYAYTYQYIYSDGIYWVDASLSLENGLLEIAEEQGWTAINSSIHEIAQSTWNEFSRQSEALMIVENLADPDELAHFLRIDIDPEGNKSQRKVLFMLKNPKFPDWCVPCNFIELTPNQAINLLLSRSNPDILANISDPQRATAREISQKLNKHPLSLALIAAYLFDATDIQLQDYREQLQQESIQSITFDYLPEDLSESLSKILHLQWEQLNEEEQNILKIASLFRESRYIPLDWLDLLFANKVDHDRIEHILQLSLLEEITNDRVSLHPLIHQFILAMILKSNLETFRSQAENILIEKLVKKSRDYDTTLIAGDLLIDLDWETNTLRKPIITALWKMLVNEEIPEPERREAGFKLLELRWPNDQDMISGEELLIYLEVINRYVDNFNDIQFLINRISHSLNHLVLNERSTAHLNVHLGVLNYRLSNLYIGASKANYQLGKSIMDDIRNEPDKYRIEDNKLEARILLGLGNLVRDHDNDLEQAEILHRKAFDLARKYPQDIILLIAIGQELSHSLSRCEKWDEADEYLQYLFEPIENLRETDPEAYASYTSTVSEVISEVHWYKGKKLQKDQKSLNPTNARRAYLLAYDNAMDAVSILENYNLNESIDMIYARFNAAECLKSLHAFKGHKELRQRIPNPIQEAETHWLEVIRIANLLGLKDYEQEAREYLEEAAHHEEDS